MDTYSPIKDLLNKFPDLTSLYESINDSANELIKCYSAGGKLLVCGNGGSSSDADHLVGELMKSFEKKRALKGEIANRLSKGYLERGKLLVQKLEAGLPAISLSAHTGLTTAISNDIGADFVFAQQIIGYGCEKDILLAISTSGNSQNIIDASATARAMNMKVIGLTGKSGGTLKYHCDFLLNVPAMSTAAVQELHLPLLHTICRIIENHFFDTI